MPTLLALTLLAAAPVSLTAPAPRAAPKVRLLAGIGALAGLGISIGTAANYYATSPTALRAIWPAGVVGAAVPFVGAALSIGTDVSLLNQDVDAMARVAAHTVSLGFQLTSLAFLLLAPLFDHQSVWRVSVSVVPTGPGVAFAMSF